MLETTGKTYRSVQGIGSLQRLHQRVGRLFFGQVYRRKPFDVVGEAARLWRLARSSGRIDRLANASVLFREGGTEAASSSHDKNRHLRSLFADFLFPGQLLFGCPQFCVGVILLFSFLFLMR